VSYGSAGGVRAAEHLRQVLGEVQIADVRSNVMLSLFTDFENFSVFKPAPIQAQTLDTLINQIVLWGTSLKSVRK
jgi:NAD(P)H-dependent FMN reductase